MLLKVEVLCHMPIKEKNPTNSPKNKLFLKEQKMAVSMLSITEIPLSGKHLLQKGRQEKN